MATLLPLITLCVFTVGATGVDTVKSQPADFDQHDTPVGPENTTTTAKPYVDWENEVKSLDYDQLGLDTEKTPGTPVPFRLEDNGPQTPDPSYGARLDADSYEYQNDAFYTTQTAKPYSWEDEREKRVEIHSCCVTRDKNSGAMTGGCRMDNLPDEWRPQYSYWGAKRHLCTWYLEEADGQVDKEKAGVEGTYGDLFYYTDFLPTLCVFTANMDEVKETSTFRVVTVPGKKSVSNIPVSSSCEMDCGGDGFACEQGFKCIGRWYTCNFRPDCTDGKDESVDTCHWWCAIDHTGYTCTVILVTAGCLALVFSVCLLLACARPSKLRGKLLQRRRPSEASADKFEIVRVWAKAFLYYSACCCCRIFVPSRQRGKAFEEWEFPKEPADDKFQAAGHFARKNCLVIAGLWLKAILYNCACCCCGVFVPSRKRGKFVEEWEFPKEDPELPKEKMDDKFAVAGRFARKNCLKILGLWLQGFLYYICCCFLRERGAQASADEEPAFGAVDEEGEKIRIIPPEPMDMKRPLTDEGTPDVVVTTEQPGPEGYLLSAA